MDDQKKRSYWSKMNPSSKNYPIKLETHIMHTYDVEFTNETNKRSYLRISKKTQIVTWGTERMTQRIQNNRR